MVPKIDPTVAAVVVVFDPDDRFRQLLLSLVEQVNKIWICLLYTSDAADD